MDTWIPVAKAISDGVGYVIKAFDKDPKKESNTERIYRYASIAVASVEQAWSFQTTYEELKLSKTLLPTRRNSPSFLYSNEISSAAFSSSAISSFFSSTNSTTTLWLLLKPM